MNAGSRRGFRQEEKKPLSIIIIVTTKSSQQVKYAIICERTGTYGYAAYREKHVTGELFAGITGRYIVEESM